MKKILLMSVMFGVGLAVSADIQRDNTIPRAFAQEVENFLATHPVEGMANYGDFCRVVVETPVTGTVDATVQACHKARKVRFWRALEHLALLKSWGLDAEEFDPDAAAAGNYPDVIFCHLQPGYAKGDTEQFLDAARHGTHVVVLQCTDQWSEVFAKRLGHTYSGVLTAPAATRGGVFFAPCAKLFAGFPKGRLDAPLFDCFGGSRHGMYLSGERCLLGVADTDKCRVASSIAQYAYGKGAITLVGPCVNQANLQKTATAPYKRLLLNLIDLLPPVMAEKPFDVLLYTRWKWHADPKTGAVAPKGSYHHFSTEAAGGGLAKYFTEKGLSVKVTDDPEVFRSPLFARCRCTVFACANEEQFETQTQREAFYAWAKAGGGSVVIHSASNCEIGRADWREFLGATFCFHYPRQFPVPFTEFDRTHPAFKEFPEGYVWPADEIYVNELVPGAVKPLLFLRADQMPAEQQAWLKSKGRTAENGRHVLAWSKDYGKGRVFYSALGHHAAAFQRPEFLQHLYLAAKWTMRDGE